MLLGALIDAGAAVETVRAAIGSLGVEPIEIRPSQVRRHGLRATKADVVIHEGASSRTLTAVLDLVGGAQLAPAAAAFARDVFLLLGTAEAEVHGERVEQVHLHEVGALDSLADVVGCAAALDALGLLAPRAQIVVSTVGVGSGSVETAHGRLPVPVPAVLAILTGRAAPIMAGGDGECCTPTGAALLATLAGTWGPVPRMTIDAVGVGAGSADPLDRANVLRVVIGAADSAVAIPWRQDDLVELEATVDDLDPRLWPAVLDALVQAGAADAWLTPVLMRKGRPGHVVTALVSRESLDAATRALFANSTTLGARIHEVARRALPRDVVVVRIDGCEVRVKRGLLDGEPVTVQAEYADAAAAGAQLGLPVQVILERAAEMARRAPTSEPEASRPKARKPMRGTRR